MERRVFLRALGGAALAGPAVAVGQGCGPAAGEGGGVDEAPGSGRSAAARGVGTPARRLERVGIQLYTLRTEMAADFEGTLARVAAIGYDEVEFAGYFGREPEAVRATLEAVGLDAPASHVPFETLDEGWERTLDEAARAGHRWVVVAWIPAEARGTLDEYRRHAERFNLAGEQARAAGLAFAYHNYDFELEPLEGRVPYDVLLEETDPELVPLEMDLFWTVRGGADPLDYFGRHPGRFPLVHVKDMDGTPDGPMADVGAGTLDFARIFARSAEAGIRHFFVEHDQPPSPFGTAEASYGYLKGLEF